MAHSSPTSLAIVNAVRASLRLVSCSSELLSIAQLRAVRDDLCETLAIVNGQIQSENFGTLSGSLLTRLATHLCFADDRRVVIDLSDWDSASDGEDEETTDANVTNIMDG